MKRKLEAAAVMTAAGIILLSLSSCTLFGTGKKYKLVFDQYETESWANVKTSYRAGAKVKIWYKEEMIGTDTDYTFYVDGEKIPAVYQRGKGFRLTFTMPEHDAQVTVRAVNSMIRDGSQD